MGCALQIGAFALMMGFVYFFMLRPENKRRKEHEEMIRSLRKGTKVRTTGGILGEVVTVNDDEVVLQVADKVRINVLRTNVSTVESARKAEGEKKKDEPSKKGESEGTRDEA